MIGGDDYAFEHAEPLFSVIAPGVDSAPRTPGREGEVAQPEKGYLHCGPTGAGHFVKMVHNGIEYGMMASLAEGLNILRNADVGTRIIEAGDAETAPLSNPECYQYNFDIADVAEVWRRGSVVGSWLLDLTAIALKESPDLKEFSGRVSDSGRGPLDRDRGDRRRRSRAGAHDRPAVPVRLAQPRRFRQQGAVGDAQAVRWSRGEARRRWLAGRRRIASASRTSPRRR